MFLTRASAVMPGGNTRSVLHFDPFPFRVAQAEGRYLTDVDGHRFDVRIGYVKRSYFNLTWYRTKAVYADVSTMDRLQVDYIIRF